MSDHTSVDSNQSTYLDDLKLYLVISLGHTIADGFHYGIDQLAREAAIHVGGGFLILWVETIVLAIAIEELIGDQFLDNVEDVLH